jgi:hypothetical protein
MINSELHFSQDPRRALQDTSPGPQAVHPTRPVALSQNQGHSFSRPHQQVSQISSTMSPNLGSFSYLPSDTQQQQQHQQQQFNMDASFGNEMQRLQQFQQLGAGQGGTGMLPQQPNVQQGQQPNLQQGQQPQQQQQQQPSNNDFLRTLMNPKLAMPAYDDQFRQRMLTAPAEPLLQAPLMDEARFLMAQGNGLGFSALNRQPFALPSPHELTLRDDTRRMRGGVIEPFPEKLHRLLTEVEGNGRSDVISFIASGKAFAIHKPDKFFKEIVPKYFRQSRLSSFKRQLNLYGFELINTGPARGGYYHEMFVKERPELCRRMRRVAVKLPTNKPQDGANTSKVTSSEFVYNAPSVEKIMKAGASGLDLMKGHQMNHIHTTTTSTQANPTYDIRAEESR